MITITATAMATARVLCLCLFFDALSHADLVIAQNHLDIRPAYHYIIVGGGTSGLTVANRLTEDPDSE